LTAAVVVVDDQIGEGAADVDAERIARPRRYFLGIMSAKLRPPLQNVKAWSR
jgi:hypothetical protein